MKVKFGIVSLGCPKNQVDAEIMLNKLTAAGYEITVNENEAEVIIVNTCGFIESAKQESIENIIELSSLKSEAKLKALVVTGCLAERYKEQLLKEIPEADVAVTIGYNENIVEVVDKALAGEKGCFIAEKSCLPLNGDRMIINEPYYAYIKIAEGCNNRCTYCAIPSIRGPLRSRTIEDIYDEAQVLASKGVKELVIVAQDTSRYGEDNYGKCILPELLEKLCTIDDIKWIRLLYAYPDHLSDELLKVMANNDKIVKYIDIPIQHCNKDVLKKMNRPGDKESLKKTINRIRDIVPDVTIRTTLIAGFPGETDKQFEELCEFVKEMRFERLGCFAYSVEEDTPAANFENQLSEKVKNRRAEIIMEQQSLIAEQISEAKVGKELEVLVEGYDSYIKQFFGRTQADAPDIDCKIFFSAKINHKAGEFTKVLVNEQIDMDLYGKEI